MRVRGNFTRESVSHIYIHLTKYHFIINRTVELVFFLRASFKQREATACGEVKWDWKPVWPGGWGGGRRPCPLPLMNTHGC